MFVSFENPCYNRDVMEIRDHRRAEAESDSAAKPEASLDTEPSAEQRARRGFLIGLAVVGVSLLGLIVALVLLSTSAYRAAEAGTGPSPGGIVVGLLRDAAIIFVAFETLVIGVLLIVLILQLQALIVLLRGEIKPMMEAANETMATVRGTTQFVSHNVVSPVMKWSGYLAGIRRIIRGVSGLRENEGHGETD